MRFTPSAFLGSLVGKELIATAIGAESGSFTSGGVDYGYIKFTTSSTNLNVSVGADVDILLVAGGAGGDTGSIVAGHGGGGGAVNVVSTRLLRGNYTVSVGTGGTASKPGNDTIFTGYNINYNVGGGYPDGTSGRPVYNAPGSNAGCSGGNHVGGGGASAIATGSSAFCPPSGAPNGANGAEGVTYNFDGTPSVYGSGGGGGGCTQPFSQGGVGGTNAGKGANYNTNATNAINGYGGGGGGERDGNPQQAGRGGNGTLIIRYTLA